MAEPSTPAVLVLLVEDDARLAALTAEYLRRHGVNVEHAAGGKAALAEARRTRFDVVLLDLMLPDTGGLEVCRELRAFTDVPIIMLTARGEEADRVLGLELGADDYLPKPFSPRELLARIQAQVRRAQGVGMTPEDLSKVFTPFFRADRSRTRHTGGAGLGLALSKRIVEAHGGRITLESLPAGGTTVRIWLPPAP